MSSGQGPQVGVLAQACILLVYAYRLTLGQLVGGHCRYAPSCSAYALDALRRRPLPAALSTIARRLLRCHPWHPGGYDPVVEARSAHPSPLPHPSRGASLRP